MPDEKERRSGTRTKYTRSPINQENAREYINKLDSLMKEEKPWLNPTLTLSDLAESIDINIHTLSQLLNEHLGKNFYDYVNSFRLNYFLDIYNRPAYKNFKLLSLAYECGFNSKTTFNTFFRKTLHKTPSEHFKDSH
jgi:YesN/AraC family two-component response regulator